MVIFNLGRKSRCQLCGCGFSRWWFDLICIEEIGTSATSVAPIDALDLPKVIESNNEGGGDDRGDNRIDGGETEINEDGWILWGWYD